LERLHIRHSNTALAGAALFKRLKSNLHATRAVDIDARGHLEEGRPL
jgi:hypothetical protein